MSNNLNLSDKKTQSESSGVFNDGVSTINQLKELVKCFVNERSWQKFHTPKNLAVSVCIEAAELLEHFQWQSLDKQSISAEQKQMVAEEMSDVLAYLLGLANVLDIDVSASISEKMKKNRKKYPTEIFHGNWHKPLTA